MNWGVFWLVSMGRHMTSEPSAGRRMKAKMPQFNAHNPIKNIFNRFAGEML